MKATGIIRRIDDLGRIVLPKEIRKSLKIKEGDMLEIYIQDNGIIMLEKYEPMDNLLKLADQYVEVIAESTGLTVCATTDSYVISAAGSSRKDYLRKDLSREVTDILKERIIWNTKNNGVISIIVGDEKKHYASQLILPIISDGDVIGSIILISEEIGRVITEEDSKIGKIATSLLIKQME